MKSLNIFFILFVATSSVFAQKLSPAMLGSIQGRQIGPAVMGGRIAAIEGVNSNPKTLYVGAAGGGVWKSSDGGVSFEPIFDKHCQAIGAIAIDQAHPDTLWVGTGESNMRNSVSYGDGIYKSIDGGDNWVKAGLEKTEHIAKIIIHPSNPNTVYVAAPGALWSDSPDRGLYKTEDGGKTWQKILYVNEKTGCADILMDPRNPNVLYASMWQFRRSPYSFISGGEGSGIYKSLDGGKNWTKIQKGLPEGEFGRVALALAPSEPDHLLAIVESKKSGLYISNDGGANWTAQSADENVTARPFYFSTLVIDPKDAKRVYRPAFDLSISNDGGYSFFKASNRGGWVHSDHHALWINPNNTSHMYLGTDGGVYMSVDRGNNWIMLDNLPVSQFYHVSIDNREPYWVYGGLQDNGSWRAPSQKSGGIKNGDWEDLYFGDGFWVQPSSKDPNIIFCEYQGGNMGRVDKNIGQDTDIQPYPNANDEKFRWNWNTPIVLSPTQPDVMYTGAQFLFKSNNLGTTWTRISPDLTTNDEKKKKQEESGGLTVDNTSAENHCTIFTISESPLDANTIWVGTDDGNLQVSTDGGKSWKNLAENYAKCGIPAGTWISSIELSKFDKNEVFVTFDNHAYGDMNTYLAKSSDGGQTWTRLNSTVFTGFAHKIKQDLVQRNMLWLGTEMGLFLSVDGGKEWLRYKANVPEYALVRDIQIAPKTHDVVLATHGRGIIILDDISPLRQITEDLLSQDVRILPSRPVAVTNGHYGGAYPNGGYVGYNYSEEASIVYYLKNRITTGKVLIEIYDPSGKKLYDMPGTKRKGINRVTWSMRIKPTKPIEGGAQADWSGFSTPMALPGKYKIKVIAGAQSAEGEIELIPDPKAKASAADRELQHKTAMKGYELVNKLAFLAKQTLTIQAQILGAKNETQDEAMKADLQKYHDELEVVRKTLVATKTGTAITGEEQLRELLSKVYSQVCYLDGRPTDSHIERMDALKVKIEEAFAKMQAIHNQFLPSINKKRAAEEKLELRLLSEEDFMQELPQE